LLLGNNSTFANNVTTSGPLGTGNVTFGGGTTISTNGTSQRAIGAPRFTFNGDVTIGQTTGGTARVSLAGVFDLGGGTRTFTLTNPQTSTTNGTETFQIGAGSTSPAVTIQNGTLAFVAGANVGSGSPASVCFRASTPFTANAGLIIGNQVRVFGAAANYLGTSANAAAVTVNSGGVLDLSSGTTGTSQQSIQVFSLSGSGSIYNGDTDGGGTATLTVNGSASTTFAGVIQDGTVSATSLVALTKTGTGTQALSGQNSYTGPTNVTGGTLQVSASGSINQSASIVVTSGGTLLLTSTSGGLNQVGNSATVALGGTGGGTLQLSGSGISETMGALTLSSNSVIDFGTFSNSNTLTFSNLANFTALTVKGWTGLSYNPLLTTDNGAATQDRLLFTIDPALTATQLSQINFFDDNGVAVGFGAKEVNFSGFTEIVPVPEPSSASLLCSLGMVGLIFYRERRRWSRISRR
jgi:autotransporter-associated beta strand protein